MSRKIKMSIIDKSFETVGGNTVICYIRTVSSYISGFNRKFKGVAKWDGIGKFDYNFAKKLALARSEIKARKYYKNLAKEIFTDESEYCNMLKTFVEQCDNQITHNKEYIKNIIESFDKK